ncbi:MAG: hypothetical protein ACXWKP_28005 [Bradyrhizobium sp.]
MAHSIQRGARSSPLLPPRFPFRRDVRVYTEIDALEGSKRTSLMQLRHRHLEKIDRIAKRAHYDRAGHQEYMVENYDRLFGTLRGSKAKEVPSDQFRKWWMVGLLLDRVDAHQAYFKKRNIIQIQ